MDFVGKFDLSECAESAGHHDLAEQLRQRNARLKAQGEAPSDVENPAPVNGEDMDD